MRRAVVAAGGAILLATHGAWADPSTDYVLHCRGCHGPQGQGIPGTVRDFRGELGQFLRVAGGRAYLIRVPGVAQSELSDARTAALLNWLLHEFGDAPDFVPFTPAEVAQHRRPPLSDPKHVRRALLQGIKADRAPR
jgi:mono/diheme cytochrome c family protein